MNSAWRSVPFAPAPGARVCDMKEIINATHSVDLDGFPLMIVKAGKGLRGYMNACPHKFLPLDWLSGNIMSVDGTVIRCSNHGAQFDAETGAGRCGMSADYALIPVPLVTRCGEIFIGGDV